MISNKRMRSKSKSKKQQSKKKKQRSKEQISLVIVNAKTVLTVMMEVLFKKRTCIANLSFTEAEEVVSITIIVHLTIKVLHSSKSTITSIDSMIIILDSNIVMMIFMLSISLSTTEEEEVRNTTMIGLSI